MKCIIVPASLLLSSCSIGSSAAQEQLIADRKAFQDNLNQLTYIGQCPDVSPPILEPILNHITDIKEEMKNRINNSVLKPEYQNSVKEAVEFDKKNNEADCVGIPYSDDDKEVISGYVGASSTELSDLWLLNTQFYDLIRRIDQ